MYFISQIGEHDCAISCLNMVLANLHHDRNYLFLKHENRFYSFKELIDIAAKYNTELIGVKVNDPLELTKCEYLPIIVTLKLENGARHSVLLTKINDKKATYYDPAIGLKSENFDDFVSKWTKHALMATNFTKTTCDSKAPSFIAKRDKITLPILQILSGISFLLATYFIDRSALMILPIIFFVLFFVFELLFRDNLIKAMRRMDQIIENYDLDFKDQYRDFFVANEKYRARALTMVPNIINAGLISLFLIFILLLNTRNNAIYVCLSIFLAVVECLVFNPYIDKKVEEVDVMEQEIVSVKSDDEYHVLTKEIRENAYKIGQYKSVFNYVSIGVLIFSSIIVMAITDSINVTYIVFYLCVCLFLKLNIAKILSYNDIRKEKDKERIKIICYLKQKNE